MSDAPATVTVGEAREAELLRCLDAEKADRQHGGFEVGIYSRKRSGHRDDWTTMTHEELRALLAANRRARELAERLEKIDLELDYVRGIPVYAYGDNEAACRFAHALENIDAFLKETP